MPFRDPIVQFSTHEVKNQVPPLEDYDLFESDVGLQEVLDREGAEWARGHVSQLAAELGTARVQRLAERANRHLPELLRYDRSGHRIDHVDYHPAYHELMQLVIRGRLPSIAWTEPRAGGHVAHAAILYCVVQAEAGICCPTTMTYASIPTLRAQPEIAAFWESRALEPEYDARCIPASEKRAVTLGMAMTEKQGGSDVRSNSTRARALGRGGPGGEYALTGHKWFCSAPMSDAFLTLAYTERDRLSCFLVPRWRPDGRRNTFWVQRLKDKLGNRANASSEIEFDATWAQMVGEDGRGVRTIIEMVQHTRLDTAVAAAGLMRQALCQAVHHARHRQAFGARLIEQALMRRVLADLALEVDAARALAFRLARAFDESVDSEEARRFARIGTAVGKYWLNKRAVGHVAEALECLGGAGYVEESILPRLYREAPLGGIWEGSANVICLDVVRALLRDPECGEVFLCEVAEARGQNAHLDGVLATLEKLLSEMHGASTPDGFEAGARHLTELMALALSASLLVRHAPATTSDAYCEARLASDPCRSYGASAAFLDEAALLERAWPDAR